MPQAPSPNRFVSGATIDLNRPPREAYNPNDPKNRYPKMLYHPTKKDPNWEKEFKRITLYNSLHPEKPEILPVVPAASTIVKSAPEEEARLAEGWQSRPPKIEAVEVADESQGDDGPKCSRGCGNPPHRGSCKTQTAA